LEKIVIIGASGHAKVVADIIEKENKYTIAGFLDLTKIKGEDFFGYKILGNELDYFQKKSQETVISGIIAIGDNWIRNKVYKNICSAIRDFRLVTAIHPSAQIGKNVKIGLGSVVMAGVTINSDSLIDELNIINTHSSIDHDCQIGYCSSIAPGTIVGGNVKIGEFTAIGLGAHLIHGISIGKHSIIGAASGVIHNVPDYVVSIGIPAKIIKNRKEGDRYL
jgi:sugar O-acyltransferase (sialic acid O-acetyltransferase NeuD family)